MDNPIDSIIGSVLLIATMMYMGLTCFYRARVLEMLERLEPIQTAPKMSEPLFSNIS